MPLSLLPVGCDKKFSYQLAPVSGRVLMNQRPLENAEVRFFPTGGQNLPHSIGFTDDQGNYTLHLDNSSDNPGAVVGEHRVEVSLNYRRKRPGMTKPEHVSLRAHEMVPSKYNRNSTLTCTVPPDGKQDANFNLKSK